VLDKYGQPVRTCGHDHGLMVNDATSCALKHRWNGALEFMVKDGWRVWTLQRWTVWNKVGEKPFLAL